MTALQHQDVLDSLTASDLEHLLWSRREQERHAGAASLPPHWRDDEPDAPDAATTAALERRAGAWLEAIDRATRMARNMATGQVPLPAITGNNFSTREIGQTVVEFGLSIGLTADEATDAAVAGIRKAGGDDA
jgi:hypothetical protein